MKPIFAVPLSLVLASAAVAAPSVSPVPALAKAKTVSVMETLSLAGEDGTLKPYATFQVRLSKPGQARVEGSRASATATPPDVFVVNGATQYEYVAKSKQYVKTAAPKTGIGAGTQFGLATITRIPTLLGATPFGQMTATTEGTADAPIYSAPAGGNTEKLTVDAKTGLPTRLSVFGMKDGKPVEALRYEFSDWKIDAPIAPATFAWTPPADAKVYVAPVRPQLLANGAAAPDFTVNDKDGKPVKLSDYRGKVVVLDFWATWCGPCMQSLPHTTDVAKKYADKNVVVLAVNVWDAQDKFDAWLPKHPEYSALTFAIDPTKEQGKDIATTLYHVSGIPTQYVIGKDGKIVKSFVGFGGPTADLENALKAAGAS